MKLKVIACDVLFREFSLCAATTPNIVDVVFLKKGLHEKPEELRKVLQAEIDKVPEGEYDAIALVYGLCGNSTAWIEARHTRLVIPKVHDCITLFLGSKVEYLKNFTEHPGTYYYTSGAWERGGSLGVDVTKDSNERQKKLEEYTEKYGEDNAKFLIETEEAWTKHYTRAAYIGFPELQFLGYEEKTKAVAEEKGLAFHNLSGSVSIVKELLDGHWQSEGFLVVEPGFRVEPTNDARVIDAVTPA